MNEYQGAIVTWIHWLFWRLRCLEGSPQDFQRLFEEIASRSGDRFVRVRAYGQLGDRKCDGLYWGDGTVYQVYSPDEMKAAETRRKIKEDLAGAAAYWGDDLTHWVFVYNTRRGLAPDVVKFLQDERAKYPDVTLDLLSEQDLWETVRELPMQDRIEILGPPPGFGHLFPLSATLPQEIADRLENGRFMVIQDILSPINIEDAVAAIEPALPFAPPLFLRPSSVEESWQLAAEYQQSVITDALTRSRERLPRFAVFSLSPVPLAIHLGFLLSDRVEVEPFQYDRDRKTWKWDETARGEEGTFEVSGLPSRTTLLPVETAIRVSLSADVLKGETTPVVGTLPIEIDLRVASPDVRWLVSSGQLSELGRAFRRVLADLRRIAPNCRRIHLFYAGPTGGAVVLGQAINPRMNPPVALYQYDRKREPRYEHVLTLA